MKSSRRNMLTSAPGALGGPDRGAFFPALVRGSPRAVHAAVASSLGLAISLVFAACGPSSGGTGGTGGTGGDHAGTGGDHAGTGGDHAGTGGDHAGTGGDHAGTSGSGGVNDAGSDAGDASTTADAGGSGRDLSPNRSAFFGASRCAQADVLLCEDFESGKLDTSVWKVRGDMPVVDGVHTARGTKALHITKNGNGLSAISEVKTFPAPSNTYFGRIFVYFNKLPTSPGMPYAHWTFAAASGTGVQGEIRLSGQLQQGKNLFGVGTDSGMSPTGTGDWTNSDKDPNGKPSAVPTQEWLCIEWMHKGNTSETRFFWDAIEHPSLYTSTSMHGGNKNPYTLPQFTNVWIGWQEYQTSTEPFEMWVDEIIIDKERIGCVL